VLCVCLRLESKGASGERSSTGDALRCCSSVMKHSKPCLHKHFECKCDEGNDDTANREETRGKRDTKISIGGFLVQDVSKRT
jgi:hypothetical protein